MLCVGAIAKGMTCIQVPPDAYIKAYDMMKKHSRFIKARKKREFDLQGLCLN